jgi:RHH-type proline utilization regulon transcriptional repressor/proline dehydrogenase/delta 1-pyrroline-5-carboxylate dehydrogenase
MSNSLNLDTANEILERARKEILEENEIKKTSIQLAELVLKEALKKQNSKEKQESDQISRMLNDERGKAFSLFLTDQCFRSKDSYRVADQVSYLISSLGIPKFLSRVKKIQLQSFRFVGKVFSSILIPVLKGLLRRESASVVIEAAEKPLHKHIKKRSQENVRSNINHLGEAILGEKEAKKRVEINKKLLLDPNIEYISIKISTIYSQITHVAFEESIQVLKVRLRELFLVAKSNPYSDSLGNKRAKFINLDMEEYKDLRMTVDLFKQVLEEDEFIDYSAGIVLQAYLPDSFAVQKELTEWAMRRVARGGAPIKIRLVKGANLAMESVEASIRGWSLATYQTKQEADANFKRMLFYACRKEHMRAVTLGLASHNIFDICLGMVLCATQGVEGKVCFEMLEGMAPHIRRVVQTLVKDLLLYCPIVTEESFQYAIGYLVRRFDENTAQENFLHHLFNIQVGNPHWEEQKAAFIQAFDDKDRVSDQIRRKQNRFQAKQALSLGEPFENESDTDWSLFYNQVWAKEVTSEWKHRKNEVVPLMIGEREITYEEEGERGSGEDPSRPGHEVYSFTLANSEHVEQVLASSRLAQNEWRKKNIEERAQIFARIAQNLREARGALIGAMMLDAGKTMQEADVEVSEAIDFAEYYWRSLKNTHAIEGISWQPLGTFLILPPWNFPCAIPAGGVLAALSTGNTVIFKPSRETVLVAWMLVKLFWEAGVPKNALQFITGKSSVIGDLLIKDERVNGVVLTGSTATAKHLLSVRPNLYLMAETGGKNALIVTRLADRDLALKDALQSAFGHAGQKCSACSLLILESEVYDDPSFRDQLKDAVESLYVSGVWDLKCKINPLVLPPSGALKQGVSTLEEGEEWLIKPKQDPSNSNLLFPGIKWGVKEGSFSHQTEFFGPLLSVMRADNLDHAIRLANGTSYGLTGGIHSLDEREHAIWLDKIEVGNCYINRGITGAIVRRQPFGGCKESSFGPGTKVGGPNYLMRFMHPTEEHLPTTLDVDIPLVLQEISSFLIEHGSSKEEQNVFESSLNHYVYAYSRFMQKDDQSLLLGQDNYMIYKPKKNVCIRLKEGDQLLDVFLSIAACILCNTPLTLSYSPTDHLRNGKKEWDMTRLGLTFLGKYGVKIREDSEDEFLGFLEEGTIEFIRCLREPSESLLYRASKMGIFIESWPVLSNGFIELLHYLREVSVSKDYHRYGNLGLRESDKRKAIL